LCSIVTAHAQNALKKFYWTIKKMDQGLYGTEEFISRKVICIVFARPANLR
jgi:hypothetical protein